MAYLYLPLTDREYSHLKLPINENFKKLARNGLYIPCNNISRIFSSLPRIKNTELSAVHFLTDF